jgi:integrase
VSAAAPASGDTVSDGCQQGVSSALGDACQQGVSGALGDGGQGGVGIGPGELAFKVKQVKTKVTKREKRNEKGEVVSVSWDVQVGSALLRVYFTPSGEREFYTVSYWVDGKRKRQVLPSLEKAIDEAKETGKQLNKGDKGAAEFSGVQRVACLRALQLLAPTGIAIEMGAAMVARFHLKIGDRATMDEVIACYDRYHPVGMESKRVAEVVKECVEQKEQDKLSDRYVKQLKYDLDRFALRFKNDIGDVTGRDIDTWLRELGVSGRTRNNIRMSVQTLFGFAKAKRYLPKANDEMDAVPVAKELDGAIEIFTPAELREVMSMAGADMVPFLAIGAFAGVRHAEIQRLDWKDVRFDAGIIEIHAGNAKTATRRTVPILPNLRAWLVEHKQEAGPVCGFANVTDQIVSLVTKINHRREERAEGREQNGKLQMADGQEAPEFKWKHNGLRHSFISYRVAAIKSVAQVALEAGNSPAMIFSNYRELVTPQDAEGWFAIYPPGFNRRGAKNAEKKNLAAKSAKRGGK